MSVVQTFVERFVQSFATIIMIVSKENRIKILTSAKDGSTTQSVIQTPQTIIQITKEDS